MKFSILRRWAMVLFALSILSACGEAYKGNQDKNSVKASTQTQEAEIFYSQFVSKANPKLPTDTKYLRSEISISQFNESYSIELRLRMIEGGLYLAEYEEKNTGALATKKGRWKIEKSKLVLEQLGTAVGAELNGRPGFLLEMSSDVLSPGIKGKVFSFSI